MTTAATHRRRGRTKNAIAQLKIAAEALATASTEALSGATSTPDTVDLAVAMSLALAHVGRAIIIIDTKGI